MRPGPTGSAPIAFAGGMLDRADAVRSDPEKLAAVWAHPGARMLLLDGLDPLPGADGRMESIAKPAAADPADHALLGIQDDGAPLFVSLTVVESGDPPQFPPKIWSIVPLLAPGEAALFGAARSLVDWHRRHRFCAQCGAPTAPVKAGWSRKCGACAAEHFPRVDPVVIMLAEFEERVLLGRNARFPPRRFSALAGFVEPGETIEEAVRRELFEEAGLRVDRVDYLMSQPWPFPSQLMIACIAQAQGDALILDTTELAEAMWVDRAQVRAAFAGDEDALFLPPSDIAVAHHMLRDWLAG